MYNWYFNEAKRREYNNFLKASNPSKKQFRTCNSEKDATG